MVDATCACEAIHAVIRDLPSYTSPSEAPFPNGLYFFFERGENSPHGSPRITRIGNHPRTQGRLVARLRDHWQRDRTRNGSVFRRYLGGALLRRDEVKGCLAPGPGLGHWEMANASECHICVGYEDRVTAYLQSNLQFACVRVNDQELRNRLERRLIASVAQCRVCEPSRGWLGLRAYPENVRSTGMWNSDHVGGPLCTESDIDTFRALARLTADGTRDLSDTLLLLPCSAAKRGQRVLHMEPRSLIDFVGPEAASGRLRAFTRGWLDPNSEPIAALARYCGQPYKTEGVVDGLLDAMARGLHVVIVGRIWPAAR